MSEDTSQIGYRPSESSSVQKRRGRAVSVDKDCMVDGAGGRIPDPVKKALVGRETVQEKTEQAGELARSGHKANGAVDSTGDQRRPAVSREVNQGSSGNPMRPIACEGAQQEMQGNGRRRLAVVLPFRRPSPLKWKW